MRMCMSQARSTQTAKSREFSVPVTSVHNVEADGVRVFYRAAGDPDSPTVLLLHGFPTSSFMFRDLIPRLANQYRVIAPDLPGFGFTEVPAARNYTWRASQQRCSWRCDDRPPTILFPKVGAGTQPDN